MLKKGGSNMITVKVTTNKQLYSLINSLFELHRNELETEEKKQLTAVTLLPYNQSVYMPVELYLKIRGIL